MTNPAGEPAASTAYGELTKQIGDYKKLKSKWMYCYYSAKVVVLVFGASIPIMTTFDAWPWVIGVAGGAIAVVEGISQLWHFHDRYVAARGLHRGLDKERILYDSHANPYDDDATRDQLLARQIFMLFDTYDSQVTSVIRDSGVPPS